MVGRETFGDPRNENVWNKVEGEKTKKSFAFPKKIQQLLIVAENRNEPLWRWLADDEKFLTRCDMKSVLSVFKTITKNSEPMFHNSHLC